MMGRKIQRLLVSLAALALALVVQASPADANPRCIDGCTWGLCPSQAELEELCETACGPGGYGAAVCIEGWIIDHCSPNQTYYTCSLL